MEVIRLNAYRVRVWAYIAAATFVLSLIALQGKAQKNQILPIHVVNGDSVPTKYLPPVDVYATRIFKSKRHEIKYNKLVYNVRKAYPYAKAAKQKLDYFDAKYAALPTDDEAKRKKMAKQYEKDLKSEFREDLSKLTVSQGRLLIKLIDRETEHTTYELIEEYRGKTSAFFWQSFASIFGTTLKMNYDREEEKDIENIIFWLESTGRV